MTDQELLVRYLTTGISLRQLGTEVGLTEGGLRYRFRKIKRYHDVVTKVIHLRIAHARGKRLKHALWQLRRFRKAEYTELLERTRPAACQDCASEIQAKLAGMWWKWKCASCGITGRLPCLANG